jgi:hypothetical protein
MENTLPSKNVVSVLMYSFFIVLKTHLALPAYLCAKIRNMKRSLNPLVLVSLVLMGVSFASAQTTLTIPAASPTSKVTQQFATAKIEISYSRPSTKGRVIFGDLVPFGELWRTGANASTKIMFGRRRESGRE